MTPEELGSMVRLGGRAAVGVVDQVGHTHRAVAGRALGAAGPLSAPLTATYGTVLGATYATVGGSCRAAAAVAVAGTQLLAPPGRELSTTTSGNRAVSGINAVVGDLLDEDDALAIRMAVRVDGRDLPLTRGRLRAAFPSATGRLAVFVHGLSHNEENWQRRAAEYGGTHGSRLADDLGYTPVYLRYNTGRRVPANGRDLADLLERLVTRWPVRVEQIALIGHSMGGLVIRSACHHGQHRRWLPLVSHAVYLGTPLQGAPLARAVRALTRHLEHLPETRALARAADISPGIRDLRHGTVIEEDWIDTEGPRRNGPDLHPDAHHHVVSAAIARGRRNPVASVVGDLLVPPSSAHGRRRGREPLALLDDHRHHHSGLNHLDLLNHPVVYETLRRCLDTPAVASTG